jgi:hypothetical protein
MGHNPRRLNTKERVLSRVSSAHIHLLFPRLLCDCFILCKTRMDALRREQEAKMMGAQAKAKVEKIELYKHRFMRDARENWSRYQEEKAEAALPGAETKGDYPDE